jgi:hypothetical protein
MLTLCECTRMYNAAYQPSASTHESSKLAVTLEQTLQPKRPLQGHLLCATTEA